MALRRDTEKARAWQQRRTPLQRTELARGPTRLKALSPKGRRKRRRQMGDDTGLAAKIRQLPCAGCWVEWWRMALELGQLAYWDADGTPMLEHRSEVGHLASRGSGHGVVTARPTKCGHGAGVPNVLPVCRTCHDQQEKRTAAWGREVAEDPEWGWRVAALVAEACA